MCIRGGVTHIADPRIAAYMVADRWLQQPEIRERCHQIPSVGVGDVDG